MSRVTIPVACIEFEEGGNTIWIQGPDGGTVLRIKAMVGKVRSKTCPTSPIPHADIFCNGDVEFCVPPEKPRRKGGQHIAAAYKLVDRHRAKPKRA